MKSTRVLRYASLAYLCSSLLPPQTHAQTYTPRRIVIEGAPNMDTTDLLRTTGLKQGVPVTKQEIEAALGHLADTGAFTDLSYTVNSDALILKLTPSASSAMFPVRYTNFVWWKPEELTPLIQQRVPLYQGKLPPTGNLTEQVEAALVAMLKDKGIDAKITLLEAMGGHQFSLAISRPEIVLGHITVLNTLPSLAPTIEKMQAGFTEQEFDLQLLTRSVPLNVTDIYNNAGYLDAKADPAIFAAPHLNDLGRYAVDVTTTVHPGDLYRIRQITYDAPPPVSRAELEKASALKTGDLAGTFTLQHAADSVAHTYSQHGYLDAKAIHAYPKDAATHTVDLTFAVTPGDLYHLDKIDASALPPSLQAAFANNPKLYPGVPVDQAVSQEIFRILYAQHAHQSVNTLYTRDRSTHLATITLKPTKS